MSAGRVTTGLIVAALGIAACAVRQPSPLPEAVTSRADVPAEQPAEESAPVAPPPVGVPEPRVPRAAALPATTEPRPAAAPVPPAAVAVAPVCVAPYFESRANSDALGSWRMGAPLPDDAITCRLVDANGRPVRWTATLRFWTRDAHWLAWEAPDGTFVVNGPARGVACDVDAFLPLPEPPGRRRRRVHAGTLRAGDRDVVLRLPVAPSVLATGTLADERGRVLAGWRVLALHITGDDESFRQFAEAVTAEDGRFVLEAWTPTEFALEIRTPDGVARRVVRDEPVAGGTDLRVIAGNPRIGGRVTVGDGVRPDGAVVRLRDVATGEVRSVTAAAKGRFVFDDVRDRTTYELSAELAGHVCLKPARVTSEDWNEALLLVGLDQFLEGRAARADGRPLRFAWIRFVTGRGDELQTLTDVDGRFSTHEAQALDFDACLLVPGADGRLVPGPKLGRCRGGDRNLELRASR